MNAHHIMSLIDSFLKLSVGMAETGLLISESAMKAAQTTIETMAGIRRDPDMTAPVNGPKDLDHAVSELANCATRIFQMTPLEWHALPGAFQDLLGAARFSFQYVDWSDPRTLLLPVQLPFSVGTMLAESSLRGLATVEAVGADRGLDFLRYAIEIFSDFPVYISLQYKDIIEKYQKWLDAHPEDTVTRAEYGRVLVKVGRFGEAADELQKAASNPEVRGVALHQRAVALYRSGDFAGAVADGCASLAADPTNQMARNWLWLSSLKLGGYPADTPEEFRMEAKTGWEKPTVEFEDIAARIGLDKTSGGRGIAIFDYNNDGLLDVVVAGASAGCSLYRNNGDGTFTDVSVGCGLDEAINGFGITVGDYNNDGYPDVFVTRLGFYGGEGELWRNNGDGTFTNVSREAGVNCWGPVFSAAWVDYDRDGFLDLFVTSNLGGLFDRKTDYRLFHNNGDGTFTNVADTAGISSIWPTIGCSWGDYNNDGYPDLFLSNGVGRPQLFRNNGDGTFTDVSTEAGFDQFALASCAFWCDIDDDGWLDVVQFYWSILHEDVIHTVRFGEAPANGHPTRIFRNNRNGTFTEIGRELGINECWGTMSGNAGDFNNDGQLDLIFGNGGPLMDRLEPLVLFERENGQFRNVTFAAGLPFIGKGHGANCADLFGDGRLSILIAGGGAYPADMLSTAVFCPKTLPGNYLNVRLIGVRSNRDAIGARLKLIAGGRDQHRVINGGSNFGCLPTEQHFGLGKLENIDALEIWWPSGLTQRFERPPVNQTIRITEGQNYWEEHRDAADTLYPSTAVVY
jgi:hypothetical protein